MERLVYRGNAKAESAQSRGWFVGQFVGDPESLRQSEDVEVRWGEHKAGEARKNWSYSKTATSMTILVSGSVTWEFPGETVTLTEPGDYLMWEPAVPHKWKVNDDALTITVRWPSVPEDIVELNDIPFISDSQSRDTTQVFPSIPLVETGV